MHNRHTNTTFTSSNYSFYSLLTTSCHLLAMQPKSRSIFFFFLSSYITVLLSSYRVKRLMSGLQQRESKLRSETHCSSMSRELAALKHSNNGQFLLFTKQTPITTFWVQVYITQVILHIFIHFLASYMRRVL